MRALFDERHADVVGDLRDIDDVAGALRQWNADVAAAGAFGLQRPTGAFFELALRNLQRSQQHVISSRDEAASLRLAMRNENVARASGRTTLDGIETAIQRPAAAACVAGMCVRMPSSITFASPNSIRVFSL